ncbi:MAG TPA: ADP-ribosylglycohydrolase family protein [Clostridia bacterium]|nr:ADP-ribosylglycohydrolase family protein [Clostridia bacterium]
MKTSLHQKTGLLTCSLALALIGIMTLDAAAKPEPRRVTREVLEDKVRGGWAGKMFGVSYGAPTEFRSNGKIYETELTWSPERVDNALIQDDLYVGMTMAETMDRLGFDATVEQYGEAFKNSQYHLWHANAGARRLLNQGVKAPWSGHPKYNIHANDIDFQIEADFIGMMTPGLPRLSNKYCDRVGRVMNYGDGLYGGMWLNGMYCAAFFENDIRKVVEQGLACIPAKSEYAMLIQDILDWTKQEKDWRKVWQLVQDKWDKNDPCTDGALRPFNIDAKLNGAYIAIGLLCGEGDFGKTLEISTRCGQDSDCNPSSAAGVLGVIVGYKCIPDNWKSGIAAIADKKFDFTQSSYNDICRTTVERALKIVERAGGKVNGNEILIPYQSPKAAKLEQWDMGVPSKRVALEDSAWKWNGNWADEMRGEPKWRAGIATSTPGAAVELTFNGSAIAIVGDCSEFGGRADVYLDGKKMHGIDAYTDGKTHDNALWHTCGLKPREHVLRIVARDDAHPSSRGKKVLISEAIVYQPK